MRRQAQGSSQGQRKRTERSPKHGGEKLDSLASSAKDKLNETLSEENKEKAKQALNSANEKLKEHGIDTQEAVSKLKSSGSKKLLAVAVVLLLVLYGAYSWYNQPEKVIARTLEKDYAILLDVYTSDPADYSDSDIKEVADIYMPDIATYETKILMLMRDRANKPDDDTKNGLADYKDYVSNHLYGYKITSIVLYGDNMAKVSVVNGKNEKIAELGMYNTKGEWKSQQRLFAIDFQTAMMQYLARKSARQHEENLKNSKRISIHDSSLTNF